MIKRRELLKFFGLGAATVVVASEVAQEAVAASTKEAAKPLPFGDEEIVRVSIEDLDVSGRKSRMVQGVFRGWYDESVVFCDLEPIWTSEE